MSSTGEITVELMQQILRDVKKDKTVVILPELAVDELNEDLHGGSCISRVTVKYSRQGHLMQHSLSLIVKVVPKKNLMSDVIQTFFIKEIQMYAEVLPRMSALLARALPDHQADISPHVYYTRTTPSYLLAIEDLAPKGVKAPERKNGLDLNHCLATFRTIARFHAASVIIHRDDKSIFGVFDKSSLQEEEMKEAKKTIMDLIISMIKKAIESWQEFGPEWADRVQNRYRKSYEDLQHVLKRDDNGFNVLNHGDFGLHNVMYRHSESSGEVEATMLVDFQCCCYNSPVLDLHRFIFASANDEVRANHIDLLLKEYHLELKRTLEVLGVPEEQVISLQDLLSEFDSKMLYGFYCAMTILPIQSINAETVSTLNMEDMMRLVEDGNEELCQYLTDQFYTSLRKLLPMFKEKNIF